MGSPDKGGLTVQLQQLPMEGQEHTEQRSTVSVLLRGSLINRSSIGHFHGLVVLTPKLL